MEENKKNTALRWKVIAGILAVALVVVSCLYVVGTRMDQCYRRRGSGHASWRNRFF